MKPLLTICLCSVFERTETFLPKMLVQLNDQLKTVQEGEVEIFVLIDNKTRMLGTKRNDLINIAEGKYVVAIDDDDVISPDYISTLVNTAKVVDTDVICFEVAVSLNNGPYKICYYDINYPHDYNEPNTYHRLPNHLMAVKKELVVETGFKPILRGEDADYSQRLKPLLKTQTQLGRVLYQYNFNQSTTVAQTLKRK